MGLLRLLSLGLVGLVATACPKTPDETPDEVSTAVKVSAALDVLPGESEVTRSGHSGRLGGVYWSPDGASIVTTEARGDIFVWSPDGGPPVAQWIASQVVEKEVAFRPDGARVAVASGAPDWATYRGGDSSGDVAVLFGDPTHRIEFSPGGELLIAHTAEKRPGPGKVVAMQPKALVGLGANRPPTVWEQEAFGFRPFAVSPVGGRVAIVSASDTVTMHDLETGEPLEEFWPIRLPGAVVHGFTPDGHIVWVSSYGGEVYNFQASSGVRLGALTNAVKLVSVQGTSHHGDRVVGEAGDAWVVVELRTGAVLWRGGQPSLPLYQKAAISPDGTRVAIPEFRRAMIIDVATGEATQTLGDLKGSP